MKDPLMTLIILIYILSPANIDPSTCVFKRVKYPTEVMRVDKYIYFLKEPGGKIIKEDLIMREEIYNGKRISIFDMYGVVDIRTEDGRRSAQINNELEDTWEIHLYWVGEGRINKYYDTKYAKTKEEAMEIGKKWATWR